MSNEKYPQDLVLSINDFRNSGWRETINNADEHGYSSYWDSFSKAARHAIDAGEIAKGKVLWLLADACSMMLKPESLNEPFQPLMVIQGKRSAVSEDFNDLDLVFFENILLEVDDYRLKARIADVLWLMKKPRIVAFALSAIDAYQQFPLDADKFLRDSKEAWHRAIILALMLRGGAGDRIQKIRDSIFSKFQGSDLSEKFYALWLSELLEISSLDEDRSKVVAAKLDVLAQEAKKAQDWHCTRMYYEVAIKWCKRIKNEADVLRLIVELAETFIAEAEQRASVAGHFLESAIHTYRKIPKKERSTYKVDERIDELHKRMNTANKLALTEMIPIETPGIDITELVEESRKHVVGRKYPEVLLALANVSSGADVDKVREDAKRNMQNSVLRHLFGSTHITRDGRVAARSPGFNSNDIESPETKQVIWQEMIQYYGLHVDLRVRASILPALQAINIEHRLTESTLVLLCGNSSIIPPGRERLWAKGLFLVSKMILLFQPICSFHNWNIMSDVL